MVASVEPHSAVFTPDSYKTALESTTGEFGGVGISMSGKPQDEDSLLIIDVVKGGPSDKAGLRAEDRIVEIDGTKLRGLASDEIRTMLRGKPGTTVNIKALRKNTEPLEIVVTREIIQDPSTTGYHFPKSNLYYFSVKTFAENTVPQMKKMLQRINNDNACEGLIIDLRRNPGGLLDSAVDMAGLFLPKRSVVVVTKDNQSRPVRTYRTSINPVLERDVPLFILIDNFTASASEILAGTLKHYSSLARSATAKKQTAPLVFIAGTQTFGKGSVQEMFPISNGCALKLTTMLYYLPNDECIQANGITPDFTLKPKSVPEKELKWVRDLYGRESTLKNYITRDEVQHGGRLSSQKDDPSIQRASRATQDEKAKEEEKLTWMERHRRAIASDSQIQGCCNMIKMLSLAAKSDTNLLADRARSHDFLKHNFMLDEGVDVMEITLGK